MTSDYDPVKAAEARANARLLTIDRIAKAMAENAGITDWHQNEKTREQWISHARAGLLAFQMDVGAESPVSALISIILRQRS